MRQVYLFHHLYIVLTFTVFYSLKYYLKKLRIKQCTKYTLNVSGEEQEMSHKHWITFSFNFTVSLINLHSPTLCEAVTVLQLNVLFINRKATKKY